MRNKANVFFWVSGSDEPSASDVTQLMQLEPSRVIMEGMQDASAPFGIKEIPVWQLNSPLSETAPVVEHIEALLATLDSRVDAIRAVVEKFEAGIHCQLELHPDHPGLPTIQLWQPIVNKLSNFKLSITFDLFLV